jgi:hypothetical protein
MHKELLNTKTLMMGVLASLTGFIFYGHINLKARVDTIDTKQIQLMAEQRDLWSKYNQESQYKINSIRTYYQDRLIDESEKKNYWKKKFEDIQK